MKTISLLFITLFFFSACSVKYEHIGLDENNTLQMQKKDLATQEKIQALSNLIQNLSITVDKNEADLVAYRSIYYAMHLANSYELVSPALFHNFLVNQNFKERGLCYHWRNDILFFLKKETYHTLSIYEVVANKSDYFLEHHAISITAIGTTFDNGILLDGWRNSGELFFIPLKEDRAYVWKEKRKVD